MSTSTDAELSEAERHKVNEYSDQEMAHRRMSLAIIEIGSCVTDIGNLLIRNLRTTDTSVGVNRGGIALGLERAVVALRNQSWNEWYPTSENANERYSRPLSDPVVIVLDAAEALLRSEKVDFRLIYNLTDAVRNFGRMATEHPRFVPVESAEEASAMAQNFVALIDAVRTHQSSMQGLQVFDTKIVEANFALYAALAKVMVRSTTDTVMPKLLDPPVPEKVQAEVETKTKKKKPKPKLNKKYYAGEELK